MIWPLSPHELITGSPQKLADNLLSEKKFEHLVTENIEIIFESS